MVELAGRHWTRSELLAQVGDLSQVAGIRLAEWSDGNERGVRVAECRTGSGLAFTILLDRGMDLGPAEFRGTSLAWHSANGFAHPMFYEPTGVGWLRTFGGGLLTGCGLTHLGAPDHEEQDLGLHGRLSHLPARRVNTGETWDGDECIFWVEGQMRQTSVFGENLTLTRRVAINLGQNVIAIRDVVENFADAPSPLMILYHLNLGFPLLDASGYLVAEPHPVRARDPIAAAGLDAWHQLQSPTVGYHEQVFYHDLPADTNGWSRLAYVNPNLGLLFVIRSQPAQLPNLIEWKMMGHGTYVLGLEPANCLVEGRSKERARGTLQFIQPGERREFDLEIEIALVSKEQK